MEVWIKKGNGAGCGAVDDGVAIAQSRTSVTAEQEEGFSAAAASPKSSLHLLARLNHHIPPAHQPR